jgi:hypothetical protein
MTVPSIIRQEPRGRPAVGFQLEVPGEVEVENEATSPPAIVCRERRADGRLVGELEARVFAGAMIIDRDGVLADKASEVLGGETQRMGEAAVAVVLPGASGFRAEAVVRTELPYIYVFAVAAADTVIDGGVVVTVRSAAPDWPAAEHMLRSLRILTRNGRIATNFDAQDGPILPVLPVLPILPIVAPEDS